MARTDYHSAQNVKIHGELMVKCFVRRGEGLLVSNLNCRECTNVL